MRNFGIVELYCGASGKIGFYNNQELGIAKAMKKKGYSCFVFYPDIEKRNLTEEQYDGITVVRCPARSIGIHGRYDWNILKQYSIDCVQVDSDNQLFAPDVIRYCKNNDIKVYNYLGTIKTDSDNPLKKLFSALLVKRNLNVYKTSKCFVKTKPVLDQLKKKGIQNAELAHVGLDFSVIPVVPEEIKTLRKMLDLPIGKKILLFVGRMEDYKRPLDMVDIMGRLDDKYYGVMIGTGTMNKDIADAIQNKCSGKVKRIEKIENSKVHQYYKAADYFLNFNEKEIFGMSMLEAMNQGCNVIAIRSPGASEIIDENSGFLVDNTNEMLELIQKEAKKDDLVIISRIREHFSWDKTTDLFDKYLKKQS